MVCVSTLVYLPAILLLTLLLTIVVLVAEGGSRMLAQGCHVPHGCESIKHLH